VDGRCDSDVHPGVTGRRGWSSPCDIATGRLVNASLCLADLLHRRAHLHAAPPSAARQSQVISTHRASTVVSNTRFFSLGDASPKWAREMIFGGRGLDSTIINISRLILSKSFYFPGLKCYAVQFQAYTHILILT